MENGITFDEASSKFLRKTRFKKFDGVGDRKEKYIFNMYSSGDFHRSYRTFGRIIFTRHHWFIH